MLQSLYCAHIVVNLPQEAMCACPVSHFSRVQLFAALWTVAHQAPLFLGFSRQEYWSGLPFPPPGDLPNPGIKPRSLTSPALADRFFTTSATWEAPQKAILYASSRLNDPITPLSRGTLQDCEHVWGNTA
ncbi:unnamed protein product [Rangifer tarandus platyrhynchus]|uniref:Uncharacterized protein n=2 Tax=Rangifer tarandus platyrhynchus TaxID=3082113 RepID=A0ABN8XZN9_RANTA|nr:unnamed protein product [Rangifer tarandus platyrhynchus]